MRTRRILLVSVVTAVTALAGLSAGATHGDVIPEPIPASEVQVDFELVADGFTTPLWAIHAPNSNNRLFVVDQVGKVWTVHVRNPALRSLFLDVGVDGLDLLVPLGAFGPGTFDERGLLGLAFHPDYRTNGLVYTYTSEPADGTADFSTMPSGVPANHESVIREWHVPNPNRANAAVDPTSSRVLLTIDQPQFNHNAGALTFGPDGMLYIALGDGGAADDQGVGHAGRGNGQDRSEGNVLGKILRIDPTGSSSANGQYGIPADNPFVDGPGADEIFAFGFRNPFRMSFDGDTLIAADVGQNDIEEVDVVVAGGNYGWPVKEGTFLFDANRGGPGFTTTNSPGVPSRMIDPIAQYDHDEGVSVAGGFVYRGRAVPALSGSYVFGDLTRSFAGPQGRVFHLTDSGSIAELAALDVFVIAFGQDRRGEVYLMTSDNVTPTGATGKLWRIVAD